MNDEMRTQVETDLKDQGLDPATILALIQAALQLLKFIRDRRTGK